MHVRSLPELCMHRHTLCTPVVIVMSAGGGQCVQVKQQDEPQVPLQAWCKQLIGTAKAMGIRVVPRPEDADS